MAENLLSAKWFTTQKGVEETIANYYAGTLTFQNRSTLSNILSQRIIQLEQLYDLVLQSERKFYDSLSITRGLPPREALDVLQKRVAEWNTSGANYFISQDAHSTVMEILINPKYRSITISEINDIMNDLLAPGGFLNQENQEVSEELVLQVLNEELSELGLSKIRSGKTKKGNEELYWIRVINGKVEIDGKNIGPDRKGRVKKALQNAIDKLYANSKKKGPNITKGDAERNAEMLREVLLPKITNSEIQSKFRYELSVGRVNKFNLARDYGVIKGFLGEVYWSAFFRYLGAKSTPVGDEKDILSGGSVATDLLINKFGFQVKNFNFKPDGSIQFGTRGGLKDAGTLVSKRMEIDKSLGDLILDIYGAYGFNQDFSDGEFANTRKHLEELVRGGLDKVLTHYIDKIIHLDATQEAEILKETRAFVPEQKTLFNSFFVIGSKIVPSSQILLTIINQLKNNTNAPRSEFQTTKVAIKEDAINYGNLLGEDREKFTWVPLKMANQVQIACKIDMNIQEILEKAYQTF